MITGLGIGLVGFGLILVYSGVTGQRIKEQLVGVFTGGKATAPPPGLVPAGPPSGETPVEVSGGLLGVPLGLNPLPTGRLP